MKSFASVFLIALLITSSLSAQTDEEYRQAAVEKLLVSTMARNILEGMSSKILSLCTQYTGGSFKPGKDLRQLADICFAEDRLYGYLTDELVARSGRADLDSVSSWHFADWYLAIRSLLDEKREETYSEYHERTKDETPSGKRAELVQRFMDANEVGPFYFNLLMAKHDAIRSFGTVLQHDILGDLPYFKPEQQEEITRDYVDGAYQYFFYHFEPISDQQLERYVEAYESASGRWYSRTYSQALYEAIRLGGRDLAAALEAEKE